MSRGRAVWPLALAFALVSRASFAEEADDAATKARLDDLTRKIDAHERASRLWFYGWSSFFLTAAAAEGAFAVDTNDRKFRVDYGVGAIDSTIGLLTTVAVPSEGVFAPPRLRAMPDDTPEARRKKLAAAEASVEEIAKQERLGHSWIAHVGSVVVNGAAGLVVWKGYGYAAQGLQTFVVGMIVAEAKIWTQPTWAEAEQRSRTQVSFGLSPRGASLQLVF